MNLSKLKKELQTLKSCIPSAMSNITFIKKDDTTCMYADNGNIYTCVKLDVDFPDCTLDGTVLYNTIHLIGENADVTSNDTSMTFSNNKKNTVTIALNKLNDKSSAFFDEFNTETFEMFPDNFMTLSEHAFKYVNSMTTDTKRMILTNVYVDKTNICGTDGTQIFLGKLSDSMSKCFINQDVMNVLSKCNVNLYSAKENSLYLYDEDKSHLYIVRTFSNQERFPFIITKEDFTEEEIVTKKHLLPENTFSTDGGVDVSINDAFKECVYAMADYLKSIKASATILVCFEKGIVNFKTFENSSIDCSTSCEIESDIESSFYIDVVKFSKMLQMNCNKFIFTDTRLIIFTDDYKYLLMLYGNKK